jgi:hypothetical protein
MFKPHSYPVFIFLAIFAWSFSPVLGAQESTPAPTHEQILSYDSDITVNLDGTLRVTETIRVLAGGAPIQHEIYRDFPTRYNDQFGNPYTVHIEVVSLERDAQPEGFRVRQISNGLRIHLTNSGELLSPGEHTYELTYTVDRGIGFFADHDELYWNVTGNGWTIPVQEARATVHLPQGIAREAILLDAYTGRQGSAETAYNASADNQGNASFRTTRALAPHESLTVVARWPKRFVSPPTDAQMHQYFLEDNQAGLIGVLGLTAVLIYYALAWFVMGRDPARSEIVPFPEPPPGFSPAAIRYIWCMAFDPKTLVALLVDLAVKKKFAILEDLFGSYILGRVKSSPPSTGARVSSRDDPRSEITADEELVLQKLFSGGDTVRLEPAECALVGGSMEVLHHHLRCRMERIYFATNARYLIPGLLISLATVVRCGFAIQGVQRSLLFLATLGFLPWSVGCLSLVDLTIATCKNALFGPYHAPTARKQAVVLSAISLPFFIVEVAGLGVVAWAASIGVVAVMVILVAINYLFHILLKTSAPSGRALSNQIEGFRMFLGATEHGRPGADIPTKVNPDLFERFLPYALALNVEKAWGEKLAAALAQIANRRTIDYSPHWYSGPSWNPITAANFATSLGSSFASAISCATTPSHSTSRRRASSRGEGSK